MIEQSWYYKELPLDFKQFIARQTLCGLDPKNTCDEFRFNIYSDQGVLVLSHIFNSKYNDSLTKFALSLYLSINFFNDYLPIHDIIVDRITCLSCKLLKMYTLNVCIIYIFYLEIFIYIFTNFIIIVNRSIRFIYKRISINNDKY